MELSIEQTISQLDTALGLASALSDVEANKSISLEHVMLLDHMLDGEITRMYSSSNFTTQPSMENYDLAMEALSFNLDRRWLIGGIITALIAVIIKFIDIIRKRNLNRSGGPSGTYPIGSAEALNAYRSIYRDYAKAISGLQEEIQAILVNPLHQEKQAQGGYQDKMRDIRDNFLSLTGLYESLFPETKFTEPRVDDTSFDHHLEKLFNVPDVFQAIVTRYNDFPVAVVDKNFPEYIQELKDMARAFTEAYRSADYTPVERIQRDLAPKLRAAKTRDEIAKVMLKPTDDPNGEPIPNMFVVTVAEVLDKVRNAVDDSYKLAKHHNLSNIDQTVSNSTYLVEQIQEISLGEEKASDEVVMNRLYVLTGHSELTNNLKLLTELQSQSGILVPNTPSSYILNSREIAILKEFKVSLEKARQRLAFGGDIRVAGATESNKRMMVIPQVMEQTATCLTAVLNISRAWYSLIGPSNRIEKSCKDILYANQSIYRAWFNMARTLGVDVKKYVVKE